MIVKLKNLNTEEQTLIDSSSLKIVAKYLEELVNNGNAIGTDINTLKHSIDIFNFISKTHGYDYHIKDFSKMLESVE